jgi:hypothetical protein
MGLLDLFRAGTRNPDPNERLRAIPQVDSAEDLAEIARTDDSPRVRLAAVARLVDDALLAAVARDGVAMDVRLAAVERISSQRLLADIIKTRKNYELMGACFARISDREVLKSIAEDPDYNPAARRLAVEQFADESYLSDVAGEESGAGDEATGGGISDARTDAVVENILATYGDLKVVRALGRFRGSERALRGLGTIARKGGEAGGLAVEYLARALGSRNERLAGRAVDELATLKDAESVSILVRCLDDPGLEPRLHEVLERIDTPQARAILDGGADAAGGNEEES